MEFLKDALKVTAIKSFCTTELNDQRINGVMEPKIDGIEIGAETYRRLTTTIKKEKKC